MAESVKNKKVRLISMEEVGVFLVVEVRQVNPSF